MAEIDKLTITVATEAADEETVILFDLLKKIKRLEDWRFEHCKHKTAWCSDKDKCEHCEFTK